MRIARRMAGIGSRRRAASFVATGSGMTMRPVRPTSGTSPTVAGKKWLVTAFPADSCLLVTWLVTLPVVARRREKTAEVMQADPGQFIVEDVQHGWHVQAWFGFSEGVPWITELRVRPSIGRTLADEHADEPVRENYPHDRRRPVPAGGITTTVLRSIKTPALFEAIGRAEPAAFTLALHGRHGDEDFLARRRPGRGGRDDAFYAMWAARYLRKSETTSHPYGPLAREHPGYSVRSIRDIVHSARQRGLLVGGSQGRAGGRLSPKAERLLRNTKGEDQ